MEQVIRILKSVFKDIPYFLHEHYPEKFFHAAIHLLFNYLGVRTQSEVASSNGRLDAVVQTQTQIFILEFKLDQSAEKALAQIKRKEYHQVYWNSEKPIIGVGINLSSEIKNIQDWKAEQLG